MTLDSFSIFHWYLLAILIYFINVYAQNHYSLVYGQNQKYIIPNKFLAIFSTLILIFLASTRTTIGDTGQYIRIYEQVPTNFLEFISNINWSGEWGFQLINYVLKIISFSNVQMYFFIISCITFGLVFFVFYKYSHFFGLSTLIFILNGTYVTNMNGVRQSLVASIFFFNFKLIEEKKYLQYFIMCLLLSTIHKSALMLLPLIFILNMDAWGKGTNFLIFIGILSYLFYPITSIFFSYLLSETTYSNYTFGIITGSAGSANLIRVFVKIVPIILSYLYKEKLKEEKYFSIFLHASILDFIFMLLASVKSWIFARFCIYFVPFSIVLLCWCIRKSGENRKIYYFLCLFLYLVYFYFEISVLF